MKYNRIKYGVMDTSGGGKSKIFKTKNSAVKYALTTEKEFILYKAIYKKHGIRDVKVEFVGVLFKDEQRTKDEI